MPFTNAVPIDAVKKGSSPYVSCPLPHRGSRKMLMLGDQNVRPIYCRRRSIAVDRLYFALASVEITSATCHIKLSLNVAAIAIACGKMVACPALATPCNASFHQL